MSGGLGRLQVAILDHMQTRRGDDHIGGLGKPLFILGAGIHGNYSPPHRCFVFNGARLIAWIFPIIAGQIVTVLRPRWRRCCRSRPFSGPRHWPARQPPWPGSPCRPAARMKPPTTPPSWRTTTPSQATHDDGSRARGKSRQREGALSLLGAGRLQRPPPSRPSAAPLPPPSSVRTPPARGADTGRQRPAGPRVRT